jgi:hypothetical protein
MQLGMIGLGRMGANIVRRWMCDGQECVVYDVSADAVAELEAEGAVGTTTLEDFVAALDGPRVVWVMISAAITGRVIDQVGAAPRARRHRPGSGMTCRNDRARVRRRLHRLDANGWPDNESCERLVAWRWRDHLVTINFSDERADWLVDGDRYVALDRREAQILPLVNG